VTNDIIERIDKLVETPSKCPHCGRDYHNLPLRQRVVGMLASHHFDPNYDPAIDDSPIVCVGADMYGPPRALRHSNAPYVTYVNDNSGYTYIEHFYEHPSYSLAVEKAQTILKSTFEFLQTLTSTWEPLALKFNYWLPGDNIGDEPSPPCNDTDCPVIEFGPATWPVEHVYPTPKDEFDWPEDVADIPIPKSPGYDFSKIKQGLEQSGYPTYPKGKK
jgi:hypothetical protein